MGYTDSMIYPLFVRAGHVPYDEARSLVVFCVIRAGESAGRKDRNCRVLASISMAGDTVIDSPIIRSEVCVPRDQFITGAKCGPNDKPNAVYAFIRRFVGFQVGLGNPSFYGLRGQTGPFRRVRARRDSERASF